ncbi:MAG: alkaline phosphatase family protein [Myxococcota bacterium]
MLPRVPLVVAALACSGLALAGPTAAAGDSAQQGRVFVMGVDGGSWNVIDAMAAAGELPHLSRLMARGASARLATVEPVSSPVVWTSIATGRSPEHTGVTDFFATRLHIRVPTAYERLAGDGVRVGLYDVLMTWPPRTFPGGFVIPGWLRRDETVTPPDVWQRAGVAAYANHYQDLLSSEDYLALAREDVARKPGNFLALARAFDLEVGAFTIYAPDMTSHRFWHAAYPDAFAELDGEEGLEHGEAVADAYRGVDTAAGAVSAALRPDDALIIVSDHGFRAREEGLRNVWVSRSAEILALGDLFPERDRFRIVGGFGAITLRVHPAPDDSAESVAERDALVERLVAHLRSLRDPEGEPVYRAVLSVDGLGRPESAPRGWLESAWQWAVRTGLRLAFHVQSRDGGHATVFALPHDDRLAALWPGGEIEAAGRRVPVSRVFQRQRFSGAHDPIGIFIAAGGPFAAVAERGDVSVLDVAPLLFHLSGRGIPDDLEGRLPGELLDPAWLGAHPPRTVEAAVYPGLPAGHPAARAPAAPADDGSGEPTGELVEKLRALGYVE